MAGRIPPTREEHPLPAIIMHGVHLTSLILLVFTGFYINSPFFGGAMGYMITIHQIAMWTFVLTTVTRLYWAFFGAGSAPPGGRVKGPDYKWFSPLRRTGESKPRETIKYYLFLRDTYPSVYKFNPLQKYTYLLWAFILIPLSFLTGLALWAPTRGLFAPMTNVLGGLAAMRTYHYLIMWAFIITVGVHIYLTMAEVLREWRMMFAWREPKAPESRASSQG
ncbi:MAG: cytochrome b/b6 domain-containing protein [Thermoleophilia bacterium]|nr:cytochrome b/b6 domain-containing protein [Thermoleophilia bacterium]